MNKSPRKTLIAAAVLAAIIAPIAYVLIPLPAPHGPTANALRTGNVVAAVPHGSGMRIEVLLDSGRTTTVTQAIDRAHPPLDVGQRVEVGSGGSVLPLPVAPSGTR